MVQTEQAVRRFTYAQAVNEAFHQEMENDPTVIVMGEDVGATGGIFQTTKDLIDRFGAERVRDTPITESAFVGAGVGAAVNSDWEHAAPIIASKAIRLKLMNRPIFLYFNYGYLMNSAFSS